jgi:hypothetical protein
MNQKGPEGTISDQKGPEGTRMEQKGPYAWYTFNVLLSEREFKNIGVEQASSSRMGENYLASTIDRNWLEDKVDKTGFMRGVRGL